jgi:phosphoglycolate phosphatase
MKSAIFDLDGTLADTLADLSDAVNHGLRVLGCPEHDYETYRYFVGNGARKLCERALPEDRKEETGRLLDMFREYYNAHLLDKTALYDGISAMLARLSENGVILAVATNKPQDAARELVSVLLPDTEFAAVLGGCEERPKKPDPAVIREITDALPSCDKIFMIGDSNVDIMTAKNSGLVSVGCTWGFRGREELENAGADFIAETPADIADFILGE